MKEVISSAQNVNIKRIKKLLTSGSFRQSEGQAVAEGVHLVRSYLDTGNLPEMLIYAESATANPEIATIVDQIDTAGVKELFVKDSLFESVSDIHSSVGVMMVFSIPPGRSAPVIDSDAILLEAVQDPGNMGAIMRTAAAAGIEKIYLSVGSSSCWSPKALRAGMGAQFSLDIYESVDVIESARLAVVPVLATDLVGAGSLYSANLTEPVAWAFGNEGQGITNQLRDACAQTVLIPQADSAVESLNVAAAVAVCLFEQYRQRLS